MKQIKEYIDTVFHSEDTILEEVLLPMRIK